MKGKIPQLLATQVPDYSKRHRQRAEPDLGVSKAELQKKKLKLMQRSRNRLSLIKCKSELALLDPNRSQSGGLADYMRKRSSVLSSRINNTDRLDSKLIAKKNHSK